MERSVAKSLLIKALTAQRIGKLDEALSYAQNASTVLNEDPEVLSLLAKLHDEKGDSETALYFARQATSFSDEPRFAIDLAMLLLSSDLSSEAAKIASDLLTKYPQRVRVQLLQARMLVASGDNSGARSLLQDMNVSDTFDYELLRDVASLCTSTKDSCAVAASRRWMHLDPVATEPRAMLAAGLFAIGDSLAAKAVVADALRLDPASPALLRLRNTAAAGSRQPTGETFSDFGQSEIDSLRSLVIATPLDDVRIRKFSGSALMRWRSGQLPSNAVDVLGVALLRTNQVGESLAVLGPALESDVSSEPRWVLVAEAQRRSFLLTKASITCSDGLLFFPDSIPLLLECARNEVELNSPDHVSEFLARAKKLADVSPPKEPADAWIHAVDAWLSSARGDATPAYAAITNALRTRPADAAMLAFCARVYSLLGDRTEALRFAGRAMELDSDNDEVLAASGRIYFDEKLYKEAQSALEAASQTQPTNAGLLEILGDSAARNGDLEGAADAYRRAAKADPTNTRLNEKLDSLPESANQG